MFMNNEEYKAHILGIYSSMVDFLADAYGRQCEVVLHELSNLETSILAIRNGHISGRRVGGPITDLALKMVKESGDSNNLVNYWGKTKDGKCLRSSTLFIKDLDGKIFALLCLNFDITNILNVRDSLSNLLDEFGGFVGRNYEKGAAENRETIVENFSNSVDDLLYSLIDESVNKFDIPPERMSMEEKISLVNELDQKGVFLIKGSVAEVARVLKISEPTVYRYFKNIK